MRTLIDWKFERSKTTDLRRLTGREIDGHTIEHYGIERIEPRFVGPGGTEHIVVAVASDGEEFQLDL